MKSFRTFFLLLLLLPLLAWGQEGVVMDAVTRELLPYVSFYVSPTCGTVSNEEGEFRLACQPDDQVRVSCVGYKTQWFRAAELPGVIRLSPVTTTMNELTVIATDDILYRLVRKLQREAKKNRKATRQYFFRMTTQYPGTDELAEAFLSAKSCLQMRDITFHSGKRGQLRHGGLEGPDLKGLGRTNMHYFLRLSPVLVNYDIWGRTCVPADVALSRDKRLYEVSCATYTDEEGTEICRITLRGDTSRHIAILDGTLYVQRKTCRLLRFDGVLHNLYLRAYDQAHNRQITTPVSYSMRVDYSYDHGYNEITSMSGTLVKDSVRLRHLVFNLGDRRLPFARSVRVGSNMLESIDRVGCDSTLWQVADIVRRTEAEERIASHEDANANSDSNSNSNANSDADRPSPVLQHLMDGLMEGAMPLRRKTPAARTSQVRLPIIIR